MTSTRSASSGFSENKGLGGGLGRFLFKDFLLYGGSASGKINNSKLAAVFNTEFLCVIAGN